MLQRLQQMSKYIPESVKWAKVKRAGRKHLERLLSKFVDPKSSDEKELFRLQETSVQDFEDLRLIAEVQVAI